MVIVQFIIGTGEDKRHTIGLLLSPAFEHSPASPVWPSRGSNMEQEKRKLRVSVWVNEAEKAALEERARQASLAPRHYLREFLFRRVRQRLDAQILDEVHRTRIDLNRVGGLLKLLSQKKVDAGMQGELSAVLKDLRQAVAAAADLPNMITARLDVDDEEPTDDH